MGRRPTSTRMAVTLSTPGLYWESGAVGSDSAKLQEMLLAINTPTLKVMPRDAKRPKELELATPVRINQRYPADLGKWKPNQSVPLSTIFKPALDIVEQASELQHFTLLYGVRPPVRSIRSLDVGGLIYLDPRGKVMREMTTIIKNTNVQHMPLLLTYCLHPPRAARDDSPTEPAEQALAASAFLDAIEHNFCITSTCCPTSRWRPLPCSPLPPRRKRCDRWDSSGCPEGKLATAKGWLRGVKKEDFEDTFRNWYYSARIVAIARRNAELERRVHTAVFRMLPFLRVTLNATNGQGRLPTEVMEHIAGFLANGVLSTDQVTRLRKHATNREESMRVAKVLREGGTKEEWLFNGGFWWQKGYDAAKAELGYDHTEWPPIREIEAVLRFLAFQPVASGWSHGKGDVVKATMLEYESRESGE